MKKQTIAMVAVAAIVWEARDRLAKMQVKKLVRETDTFEGFSRTFTAGWEAAERQYTRYYTDEQYKLVFGKDREQ